MTLRHHVPALLALCALVLVALWPLPLAPATTVVGHPYGDMPDHLWGTWWFGRELLAGRLPTATNLSHFPDTLALWYVDPLGALLALPFHGLGPALAWNVLVWLQLSLAALTAYAVGWDLTGSQGAALVAGVVGGLSPYALGLVHSGLAECLGMAPVLAFVPLALRELGLDPRRRPPLPGRGLYPSLALGLAASASAYYGLFGALFLLSAVLGPGWRQRLGPASRVLVVATMVALPAAALGLAALGDGGAVSTANAPGWTGRLPATDLLTFVHPGDYYFPDTPRAGNPGVLHVNYLGWTSIVLAALAARGPFLRVGLVYLLFALGPRLALGGEVVTLGKSSVLLPLGFLSFPGSPFGMVHQPYRLVAFLVPWLAMAAAMAAVRLAPRWRPLVALAVLAETLFCSPSPWPLATREAPDAADYAGIEGPVLDWPPDASRLNRDYLVDATAHGLAVPYGVNVFLPEKLRQDPLVDQLLRALNDLDGRARNRDVPWTGSILAAPSGTATQLGTMGFAAVVVHKSALDDREWGRTRALLREALGPPARENSRVAVWNAR